jgi:hypothetical protein
VTTATYLALADRAVSGLRDCGGAIVDATFHTAATRDAFVRRFGDRGAPVLFIECRAPVEILERRTRERAQDPERISDATVDVVRRQVAAWEAFAGVPVRRHLVVRADRPVEAIADEVLAWLDRRLEDQGVNAMGTGRDAHGARSSAGDSRWSGELRPADPEVPRMAAARRAPSVGGPE